MVDNRVRKEPQGEPMGYTKGSKLQVTTPVGTDKISYLFSDGGDSRGGTGTAVKVKISLKKTWTGSLEAGVSISKNLTPCFFKNYLLSLHKFKNYE